MGISAVASYIGGALIDVVDLDAAVVARCFPTAAAWPGRTTFADLAERQLRRRDGGRWPCPEPAAGREPRLPDPGLRPLPGRRRGAPVLADDRQGDPGLLAVGGPTASPRRRRRRARPLPRRARPAADATAPCPRDELRVRRARARRSPLDEVEDARSIVRRFVVSAMSVGALQPGGPPGADASASSAPAAPRTPARAARTRPGTRPGPDGRRHDARIKQVASARFGVTADVPRPRRPARDQDRPGLQARRGRPAARVARRRPTSPRSAAASPARATSARRRTTTSTRSRTSPSSSPTCARSTRGARIGVKLVAGRGVGTIAAGVAKAGAYVHPPVRPRRRDRRVAAVARSSTSGRRGSSAWPRSTRSCCATTCATGSRCARTAASRPGATCSSPRCSAPRSSRSGRRRSSRSAATWPASATSTPARPGSPPSARTCAPSSPARPTMVVRFFTRHRRGPPPRAGGGRRAVGRRDRRREPPRSCARSPAARAELGAGHRRARRGRPTPARRAEPGERRPRRSRHAPGVGARGRHRGRVPRPGLGHGRRASA